MTSADGSAVSRDRSNALAGLSIGRQEQNLEANDACPLDTGVVVISRGGVDIACRLGSAFSRGVAYHVVDKYGELVSDRTGCPVETFPLPVRPVIGRLFKEYQRLILVMPAGAAVRLVAPLLDSKRIDPAVVCVDEAGRFAVSLLSGHLGGADALAREVADALGATAVITSASYVKNTLAVDLLGREYGWQLEADSIAVTRVSAAVVNGEPVAIWQETGEQGWMSEAVPLPANLRLCASPQELVDAGATAAVIISDRASPLATVSEAPVPTVPMVVCRPRSLVVGMGCRRGVSQEHLEGLLKETFDLHNLSPMSIKCIATAEIKRDEPGILGLAGKYGVPLVCFGAEELNSVFDAKGSDTAPTVAGGGGTTAAITLTRSHAARRLLGVWGVSEPAALLASGAGQLLVGREKTDRATIAVARIPFD